MKKRDELKELREKDAAGLARELAEAREKLRDLRFRVSQGQEKRVREIRALRVRIARILAALRSSASRV